MKTLATKQKAPDEPQRLPFGVQPRPKYEVPQEELDEIPTTDPDAAHIDPARVADKPS